MRKVERTDDVDAEVVRAADAVTHLGGSDLVTEFGRTEASSRWRAISSDR